MSEPLSKSQIDRLGIAIKDGTLVDEQWNQFRILRSKWGDVELALKVDLRKVFPELNVDITTRLKNFDTIREKLVRSTGRLSQMRDVVGCRVVVSGFRREQDNAYSRICDYFKDHKIKTFDRRIDPNHHYRALHLEIDVDEIGVEIQIRTPLQHGWAETFELLADIGGRGIRYGDPLNCHHLDPSLQVLLSGLFESLVTLSNVIDTHETMESQLNEHLDSHPVSTERSTTISGLFSKARHHLAHYKMKLALARSKRKLLGLIKEIRKTLVTVRRSIA